MYVKKVGLKDIEEEDINKLRHMEKHMAMKTEREKGEKRKCRLS